MAAPTVFFDSQLMLGLSLAVLALLQFGWWGVAVGGAGPGGHGVALGPCL